jgi:hypothetical protein
MASFFPSQPNSNQSDPSPSSNRTPADLARWQTRIQEVHSSHVTPEMRQRIQETASRKQRTMKVAKKAKRLETANYLSSTTNMYSLRGLTVSSATGPDQVDGTRTESAAPTTMFARQQRQDEDYLESSTRTKKWSSAIQNSVRSPQVMNDEDEEALDRDLEALSVELQIEAERQQGLTPHNPSPAIQSAQAYGQMTHHDRVHQQTTVNSELDSLLIQFHHEPTQETELLAKFTLYETFLETVITLREETMKFWTENQDLFDTASRRLAQNEITHIDRPDTMGILIDENGASTSRRWFVYDMTKKVSENNQLIGRILANLRTRLEMLSSEEDLGECPFCLEDLTVMAKDPLGNKTMVLTCCHRVCRECWENWVEIKGPTAFCPLCRHEEFVQDILL